MPVVDAWRQHPTLRRSNHEMFASLRRWTGQGLATPRSRPSDRSTNRATSLLMSGALDFPELTIVCGHIGYPWPTEMIAVADKHAGVHIDTSAYTARRYPPKLVEYLRGRGRRKVLVGSNYPMITPGQTLEHLPDLHLDEEVTVLFLSADARSVFRLDDHS
ncbi:amidohydrolase family protein [Streptomyces sp. NPDC087263]|uniref:amidohydrolase family protein n=1 Tax=Streptomyces sp. NPDC087263 TaxID=3365773 RepID=UPI0038114EC4